MTSPMAPFLDVGSMAFDNPEKFGYKLRARTLEEHRAPVGKLQRAGAVLVERDLDDLFLGYPVVYEVLPE